MKFDWILKNSHTFALSTAGIHKGKHAVFHSTWHRDAFQLFKSFDRVLLRVQVDSFALDAKLELIVDKKKEDIVITLVLQWIQEAI